MLGIKVEVHMEVDGTRIAVIRYRYAQARSEQIEVSCDRNERKLRTVRKQGVIGVKTELEGNQFYGMGN